MTMATTDISVVRIDRLDLTFAPQPWPFADTHRPAIDAHFVNLQRARPALWNGRVLLLHRYGIERGVFGGSFLETDFASFLAWRDWGFPEAGVTNSFSMAALRSSDGAYLLGAMGDHTAGAGKVYFPAGTPDPEDVTGGMVDLGASVVRELAEETGLTAADVVAEPGWYSVLCGPRVAHMKILNARDPADVLRARIRAHLLGEAEPELSDVVVVRGRQDFDSRMPAFVTAFLEHVWSCACDDIKKVPQSLSDR
jgi:8-oxo-dGTP pyrophosphatase MutT (NUDIX family)